MVDKVSGRAFSYGGLVSESFALVGGRYSNTYMRSGWDEAGPGAGLGTGIGLREVTI